MTTPKHDPYDSSHDSSTEVAKTRDIENADPEKAVTTTPDQPEPQPAGDDDKPMNPMDPRAFPDGGLEAWLAVSGGFACLFCSFGWINAIGVFQTYYESNQLKTYSPSTIAWIPSLETFMMFAGGPIVGKLYDNYGPRWILLVGSFFTVFGLMMTSISTEYYQFILAQGICNPLGASMVFYPALNCVLTWFFKRRAFAVGIVASGSSLGGVIFPIMVQRLIPRVGFGWSIRISAFLMLAMLSYANLTVKSRIPPVRKPWSVMDFVHPLKEIPFLVTVLASFFFFLGMFLPFTFVILSAQRDGMGAELAGYLISILNAVSIIGRTLPGFYADKFGRFNAMIFTTGLSTILVLALWLPAKGNVPYILFAAFFGFSSGAFITLVPACVAQISDVRQIGVRNGSLFAIISVAALVGNPIGGALVTAQHGDYSHLKIFGGCVMATGTVTFFLARSSLVGLKLKII